MKNKCMTFTISFCLCLALGSLFLCSCEDKMEEHNKRQSWVGGNVWEVLSGEEMNGAYSMFLDAIELTGYRDVVEGKGVMTVMAPDNDAFAKYLQEHGYASVKEMQQQNPEGLKTLVGFHLLYYVYGKDMMENFRPEGEGAADGGNEILDPGMYYKFRTRSGSPVTQELDLETGKTRVVYHLERLLPVFSHYFFSSKKIDAKSNYEFFYPNSTWTGADGFNVAEATVKEYAVSASNGYIYTLDKVLEPGGTIYDELKENPDYSDFLTVYNQFSTYTYDANLSTMYGSSLGTDSLFLHEHKEPLAPIALEWPTSNYKRLDSLAYRSYSVFAPTNKALSNFFNGYWKNSGYTNFNNLDRMIQQIFLNEFVYRGSVVFPEEIASGKVVNNSGMPYGFNPWNVSLKKMCSNGSLYGLDEIEEPVLFGAVTGPAFSSKNYLYFLYTLQYSGILNSYASPKTQYTLLVPPNEVFETSDGGYQFVEEESGNSLVMMDDEQELVPVPANVAKRIVDTHTVMGNAVSLKTSGTQVVPVKAAFNFWFIKDGKITCSNFFNQILDPQTDKESLFVPFREITNSGETWSNGKAYTYENDHLNGLFDYEENTLGDRGMQALLAQGGGSYPYFRFSQLLKRAGVVNGNTITFLNSRVAAFIPTNEAIEKALEEKRIPGVESLTADNLTDRNVQISRQDSLKLQYYVENYFMDAATLTTCPYPGSAMQSGEYHTVNKGNLSYTDNGTSISVRLRSAFEFDREENGRVYLRRTDVNGAECPVDGTYWYFPFSYSDGCFHLINSLLY